MHILEILGKIGFDWKLALANLVNIGIIFLVLHYFAWKPIKRKLQERDRVVKEGLSHARKAEASLKDAESEKGEIIAQAKRDALIIIEDAERERKKIVHDAHMQAEKHTSTMLEKAARDIEESRAVMEREVEAGAAELVTESVRKILKAEVTPEMNERIVKEIVKNHG